MLLLASLCQPIVFPTCTAQVPPKIERIPINFDQKIQGLWVYTEQLSLEPEISETVERTVLVVDDCMILRSDDRMAFYKNMSSSPSNEVEATSTHFSSSAIFGAGDYVSSDKFTLRIQYGSTNQASDEQPETLVVSFKGNVKVEDAREKTVEEEINETHTLQRVTDKTKKARITEVFWMMSAQPKDQQVPPKIQTKIDRWLKDN